MEILNLSKFRDEFNKKTGSVKFVAILSPT